MSFTSLLTVNLFTVALCNQYNLTRREKTRSVSFSVSPRQGSMSGTLRLSASSQSARTNQIPFRHNALFPYIWQSEFHSSLVPARPVQTGKALLQVREATVIYLDLFSVSFGLVHSTLSFATTPENTCQATMISPVQTSLDSPTSGSLHFRPRHKQSTMYFRTFTQFRIVTD